MIANRPWGNRGLPVFLFPMARIVATGVIVMARGRESWVAGGDKNHAHCYHGGCVSRHDVGLVGDYRIAFDLRGGGQIDVIGPGGGDIYRMQRSDRMP